MTKQIHKLLQDAVIEWKNTSILIQWNLLYQLYIERDDLRHVTDDELSCLLLSNIEENYQTKYWIKREPERSLQILSPLIISEQLDLARRRRILASLRQIGDVAVPFLATLLLQPTNVLKTDAIEMLEQFHSAAAMHALKPIIQEREEWEKQRRTGEGEWLRSLDQKILIKIEAEKQKIINDNWKNSDLEKIKSMEQTKDIDGIVQYLSSPTWVFRWAAVDALVSIPEIRAK